jgi:hypothetical protein
MTAIALNYVDLKTGYLKKLLCSLFILLFLWIDFTYLNKGANNLYMINSEKLSSRFKQAINIGVIRPSSIKLYIWETHRDANTENAIKWTLGDGYFFSFYQNSEKKMIFVDSIYERSYSFPVSSFIHFNKEREQIIYIDNKIIDITNGYLRDSLQNFDPAKIDDLESAKTAQYDQQRLIITYEDLDKFFVTGFYNKENGIRWTNGNASISFAGGYIAGDSLNIVMNTYMPSVCKNVAPKISLTDSGNRNYEPALSRRDGDKFTFKFYLDKSTIITKINIKSETVQANSRDVRILSFPFISLELDK